jgi:hypothetical protein
VRADEPLNRHATPLLTRLEASWPNAPSRCQSCRSERLFPHIGGSQSDPISCQVVPREGAEVCDFRARSRGLVAEIAARVLLHCAVMVRSSAGLVLPFVALALVLSACGGSSFSNGGDPSGGTASAGTTSGGGTDGGTGSGGGNQGGASTGGKAQAGSHSGGTATGGKSAGGTGSGGSSQCDAFLDEPGSTVAVRIVNETQLPIYLGPQMQGCGGAPLFGVVDAAGKPLQSAGYCSTTCEQIMHNAVIGCPPIACVIGSTITLQPGESTIQQWSGAFLVSATLPAACRPADGTNECERVAGVKPGVFTFSSQAGTKLDCSQFGGGTCQACMPDSSGGCATPGAVISGTLLSAETMVTLDGSYGVGGSGGGGMARTVEVVFKD